MGKLRRFFKKWFRRSSGAVGDVKPTAINVGMKWKLGHKLVSRLPGANPLISSSAVAITEPRHTANDLEPSLTTSGELPLETARKTISGGIDGGSQGTKDSLRVRAPPTSPAYDAGQPPGSPTDNKGAPSSSISSGGLLQQASGFVISGSIIGERVEVHHSSNASEPLVLEKMMEYIIPGSEFDSSDRDDPPRCRPNTRTLLLEQLQMRIHDASLGTRIIWLVGPAGVGKTAIMQTLAELESPHSICATLFFSRAEKRSDPRKVFATLAYRFAIVDSEYRHYIGEKLAADPGFFAKSVEEQFKRLFVTPFATKLNPFRRLVVFLDGLDECIGEKQQCRILDLIHDSILYNSETAPFTWIIASRPEAHLWASFSQVKKSVPGFWKLKISVNSDDALQSVERYLREEFTRIQQSYPDVVPSFWPSEHDFQRVTLASSGLFAFASDLINYVGEEDPVLRLQHILLLIDRPMGGHGNSYRELKANPFQGLDLLYSEIMAGIPSNLLSITKTLLAFYLLVVVVPTPREPRVEKPAYLLLACNILGLEQHTVYAALRKLHSVLAFPLSGGADKNVVQFVHASFPDFLKDKTRSQSYYIDLNQELEKIWRCYLKILRSVPSQSYLDDIILSWETPGMASRRFRETLLGRARGKWLNVLIECCHKVTCKHEQQYRLELKNTELVKVFEEFTPVIFESEYLNVEGFCTWIFNHAPFELRQRLILREFNLEQLNEYDLDDMFKGLHTRKWGCYVTESSWRLLSFDLTDLNPTRWDGVKWSARNRLEDYDFSEGTRPQIHWSVLGELFRLKSAEYNDIKVIILGTKPTYYTIIGPVNDHPSFAKDDIQYLIFPHIELHSTWSKASVSSRARN